MSENGGPDERRPEGADDEDAEPDHSGEQDEAEYLSILHVGLRLRSGFSARAEQSDISRGFGSAPIIYGCERASHSHAPHIGPA
ncbi:hypothetical protein A1351_13680 [Methylosinus sp. R-45379]|nr:hypothetical protein A1351_13680 [Methylosinus sp. R-45379]